MKRDNVKKLFVGLVASLALLLPTPAFAASGTMTEGEFLDICAANCSQPDNQTQVENGCNCTGDLVKKWTDSGWDFKNVNYNNSWQVGGVQIKYRRDANSTNAWKVRTKRWCDNTGCVTFPL